MSAETPVTVQPGTLPYECYPADPQTLNVDIVTGMSAFIDRTFVGIYKSNTAPPINQRDWLWFNTDSSRVYQYIHGDWMRHYEVEPESGAEWIWKGTPAALLTFAVGPTGNNAIGLWSGPLWEIDHELDGRVLVGAGDVPGSSPAVSIAQGAIADSAAVEGEYQHVLTIPELPAHDHATDFPMAEGTDADPMAGRFLYTPKAQGGVGGGGADVDTFPKAHIGPSTGGGLSHKNMPQFRARYVIKRTMRVFVTSPY